MAIKMSYMDRLKERNKKKNQTPAENIIDNPKYAGSKKVVFNPDRTKTVQYPGRKAVTLSKEEYKTAELGKGGKITPNVAEIQSQVAELQDIARRERIKAEAAQKMADEALIQEVRNPPQIMTSEQQAIQQKAIQEVGVLTPEQQAYELPEGEKTIEGITTAGAAVGGALVGAKTGAALGTAITPGVGTAIGAGVGAAIGAVGGAFTKISYQERQQVKNAYSGVFIPSTKNMAYIINEVNAKRMTAEQAEIMWDNELTNLFAAERRLKELTDSEVERFLSGGVDEMTKVEAFKRKLPQITLRLQNYMLRPDPNIVVDFGMEEEIE